MKRLLALLVAAIIFVNMIPYQAMAAENGSEISPRILTYIDLSSNNTTHRMSFQIDARDRYSPPYRFYTNSTIIRLHVLANPDTSIRVSLYGSYPYNFIVDPTHGVNNDDYYTFEFTNLVHGIEYYFVIENLGDNLTNFYCIVEDWQFR